MPRKKTEGEVRDVVESKGFELVSPYKNSQTKITVKCSNGHLWSTLFGTIRDGHNCSTCSGKRKRDTQEVKTIIESEGYKWVSGEYKNCSSFFQVLCSKNHTWNTTWNRWRDGNRCPWCAGKRVDLKEVQREVSERGYEQLSEFKGRHKKIGLKCPNGHEWSSTWGNFAQGNECGKCSKKISKPEREIGDYILSIYDGDVIFNTRKPLTGKEIDIFIPSLHLGIEYNGLYWHSEGSHKNKYNLLEKTQLAELNNIRLIHILEDEWLSKTEICKTRLKHILKQSKRVFARKCQIKTIPNMTARLFCNEYHIQGAGKTSIAYGLFYEDDLKSVMTFAPTSIAKGGNGSEWELNRFCSKISIVGGAGRLFKKFIKEHSPTKVVSFCDLRWNTGKVYEKIGMEMAYKTKPNYWYFKPNNPKRLHRYNFTKHSLVKKGADPAQTERQIMNSQGFFRIYDCGNSKYLWREST